MSWAIVKNNQVIEILNGAKAVTINGIQYPSTIFNLWTKADLKNTTQLNCFKNKIS
jgi:hypothetical protein